MENLFNILDFIPVGKENAVERIELVKRTGLSDRDMRAGLEKAREKKIIINLSDGHGYFRPDKNSPDDVRNVLHYAAQEESRKRSIEKHLAPVYEFLEEVVLNEQ